MKKTFELKINQPCGEKWSDFTSTEQGGFCGQCQKNVIDFTNMTEQQIIAYFRKQPKNVCGRFREDQVKAYQEMHTLKIPAAPHWLKASMLAMPLLFTELSASAKQTDQVENQCKSPQDSSNVSSGGITVSGHIYDDEENDALPGATVLVKGTTNGTVADMEGYFELKDVQEGDVILVSFIGYETTEYKIDKKDIASLDLHLNLDLNIRCDVTIMGEVQLNELYRESSDKWWQIGRWFRKSSGVAVHE